MAKRDMKVFIVAAIITVVHLAEDLLWLTVGRFTNIPFWVVIIAIVTLGIIGGIIVRHPKAKRFLGH